MKGSPDFSDSFFKEALCLFQDRELRPTELAKGFRLPTVALQEGIPDESIPSDRLGSCEADRGQVSFETG